MRPRLPLILWRMLFGDLGRLLLLSAVVFTAVIAFAAAVRPLADGKLGPAETLKYMALASVPMLQFAVPFAAGFAATLTYHRFGSENESVAASAGGISRGSTLVPALGAGLILAAAIGLLGHQIVPQFLHSMKRLVTRDVSRMLINAVDQGQPVNLNGTVLHADELYRLEPDRERGVTDRLLLQGVVALETDEQGDVRAEVAAEQARVWLTSEQRGGETVTVVRIRLEGAVGKRRDEVLADVGGAWVGPWIVPDAFSDNPKFHTYEQLQRLSRRPDRFGPVASRRSELAAAMARRHAREATRAMFEAEKRIVLIDPLDRRLVLRPARIERQGEAMTLHPAAGERIEIDRRDERGGVRRQSARRGRLEFHADPDAEHATVTLHLEQIATRGDREITRERFSAERLRLPGEPAADLFTLPSRTLLRRSRETLDSAADPDDVQEIREARRRLSERIAELRREITAVHHERTALAGASLLMTVVGAVMALRLRRGAPLHVYLWCFFPALGAVVTISGGENAVSENVIVGLIVLWGGVGALALYTLYQYAKLRRH